MPQQQALPDRGGVRGLLMERRGPLPVWAWVAMALALLLALVWWRRNQTGSSDVTTSGPSTDYPDNLDRRNIFVLPQSPAPVVNVTVPPGQQGPPTTVPPAPPGGGRPTPPGTGPVGTPVPSPPGIMIRVDKYTTKNPPWNSTLTGIFAHLNGPSPTFQTSAKSWQEIWNHPLNAALRQARGQADRIQPQDQVFVPGRMK